jgi:hypothetical protein
MRREPRACVLRSKRRKSQFEDGNASETDARAVRPHSSRSTCNSEPWQEAIVVLGFMSVGLAIVAASRLILWVYAEPRRDAGNEMPIEIGQIEAIFGYPVKSMRGEPLDAATLGWHGLDGDRRLAFRRLDERSGFPWLTASKLPELIHFSPQRRDDGNDQALPTHVLTPQGEAMPLPGRLHPGVLADAR